MTERPSDADTAMVVAEQHDIVPAIPVYSTTGNKSLIGFVGLGGYEFEVKDPRDDPDAALELLGWLVDQSNPDITWGWYLDRDVDSGWMILDRKEGATVFVAALPDSCEPFRYAVVALAVKVMGGGEAQQRKPGGPPNGPPS